MIMYAAFTTTNPRYLNHAVNRRCDDLVELLFKFEEDMFHNRISREIISSPKDASLCQEGTYRHQSGMQISDSDVKVSYYEIITGNTCNARLPHYYR